MSPANTTIDKYIAGFPPEVQDILNQIRAVIQVEAPQATEKISYGIPTFFLNGNLVHFAAYKNHIGFYPGSAGIKAFKEQLSEYKSSKGTVQFPLNKTIPFDLIRKITRFRVEINSNK